MPIGEPIINQPNKSNISWLTGYYDIIKFIEVIINLYSIS